MATAPRRRKYSPGPVDGTELTLVEYDESDTIYGWFDCSCGERKRIRNRYVFVGYPAADQKHDRAINCGGPAHPDKRSTTNPAYRTVHVRLNKRHGPASTLPCGRCGEVGKGQWAYLWSSSTPQVQAEGLKDAGLVYSVDGEDYAVLCQEPCHGEWDRANRKVLAGLPKGAPSLVHVAMNEVGYFDGLGVEASQ